MMRDESGFIMHHASLYYVHCRCVGRRRALAGNAGARRHYWLHAWAAGAVRCPVRPPGLDPPFVRAAQLVEAGTLGTLRQARCDWSFAAGGVTALAVGGAPEAGGWSVLLEVIACQTADLSRAWLGGA